MTRPEPVIPVRESEYSMDGILWVVVVAALVVLAIVAALLLRHWRRSGSVLASKPDGGVRR